MRNSRAKDLQSKLGGRSSDLGGSMRGASSEADDCLLVDCAVAFEIMRKAASRR